MGLLSGSLNDLRTYCFDDPSVHLGVTCDEIRNKLRQYYSGMLRCLVN